MKVLLVPVLQPPRVVTISGSLESLQSLVGGWIGCTYPWEEYVGLVHNDNGIAEGLPPNRVVGRNIIFGDFFICGIGEEDFTDLSPELVEHFTEMFKYPELIVPTVNGKFEVVKILKEEL